jgi:hypothetical protein
MSSCRFEISTSACFQPRELRRTEYITNRNNIIDEGPGALSDQAINWIGLTDGVKLRMIDANLSDSLEQAKKFDMICDLNDSLVAKVTDLELTNPIRDSQSMELAATQREIEELHEDLYIEKPRSAKLERRLDLC